MTEVNGEKKKSANESRGKMGHEGTENDWGRGMGVKQPEEKKPDTTSHTGEQ